MKRETLNSAETQMDSDVLLPLVDDMLINRQNGVEKINEMFGTNISVSFNSAWLEREQEQELEQDLIESQIENSDNLNSEEGEIENDDIRDREESSDTE